MGLDDRLDLYLGSARDTLQSRCKQAEVSHMLREARQAKGSPWRSALASAFRAAAERLEPHPLPKGHL